jgi:branched-chain amino acid transport system ATP-binding protein
MDKTFILEATDLRKNFLGFVAVDGVNLKVRRGSIHALIGPNGAGKSTCFNLLTKFLQPSSGVIRFNGEDITRTPPAAVARKGMVRSFQISATFPALTVLQNVRIALQRKLGSSYSFWLSKESLSSLDPRARELLASVGLADAPDLLAGELPYGRRRALELATTLALEPELLLLDEPTQGMGHEDVELVTDLIQKVARVAPYCWSSTTWPWSRALQTPSVSCSVARSSPKVPTRPCRPIRALWRLISAPRSKLWMAACL